jgi:hypothetical protein
MIERMIDFRMKEERDAFVGRFLRSLSTSSDPGIFYRSEEYQGNPNGCVSDNTYKFPVPEFS